jgi:hypothetical protein
MYVDMGNGQSYRRNTEDKCSLYPGYLVLFLSQASHTVRRINLVVVH